MGPKGAERQLTKIYAWTINMTAGRQPDQGRLSLAKAGRKINTKVWLQGACINQNGQLASKTEKSAPKYTLPAGPGPALNGICQ